MIPGTLKMPGTIVLAFSQLYGLLSSSTPSFR